MTAAAFFASSVVGISLGTVGDGEEDAGDEEDTGERREHYTIGTQIN